MGQAFRRASGRIRAATDPTPSPKNVPDRKPPVVPTDQIPKTTTNSTQLNDQNGLASDAPARVNLDNVLEERDPQYDVMLSQMVGRIKSKPGGKPEIGEASVVERYNRPMPKLRNTKPGSSQYEDRPARPGTLNVAQLRHMMLLYQGKADDHNGPMDVHQIAEKFRLEVSQVQRFLEFMAIPPEESVKRKGHQ